jgi:hypothetical protein
MLIRVTQDHINAGIRRKSKKCPIALSVLEQTGADWCTVGIQYANYTKEKILYYFALPSAAKVFVSNFDDGLRVEPFEMEIEPMVF